MLYYVRVCQKARIAGNEDEDLETEEVGKGEPLPLLGGEYMPMDSGAPQTVVGGPGDSCGFPGDSCGVPGDSCGSYGILWRADGEWRKRAVEKAIDLRKKKKTPPHYQNW